MHVYQVVTDAQQVRRRSLLRGCNRRSHFLFLVHTSDAIRCNYRCKL